MTEPFNPSQVTLLLADDDSEFRASVARRFLRRGFRVYEAANGAQAVQRAGDIPCDVAIVDLVMPGMSGLEVLKSFKAKFPLLPVVIMTGQGSADSKAAAIGLGALAYIQKPIPLNELENLVERAYISGHAPQLREKAACKAEPGSTTSTESPS